MNNFKSFTKLTRFKDLILSIQNCNLCPRMRDRKKVFSEANGNLNSKVLFIAEAPGRLGADKTGIPLYGDKTGDNFELLLGNIGWKRKDIFITNAVLCNPRKENGNNSTPRQEELSNCRTYLEMILELLQPHVVVALGTVALKTLNAISPHGLTLKKSVGQSKPWEDKLLVPLYHPGPRAMIHRNLSKQCSDFMQLAKLVDPIQGIIGKSKIKKQKTLSEIVLNNTKREKHLVKYATRSSKSKRLRREEIPDKSNIRPSFFHDADRIIHSKAYTRYIDKTQAFFLFENDHITHRALHVQFVSKIARVIGRCLKLNEDLIEAIALGHDLGHCPYGHDGEEILDGLCIKHKIGSFCHSAHSIRLLMELEGNGKGLNLTCQVLDGILCHNGEILNKRYEPSNSKSWDILLEEYNSCMQNSKNCKKIFPMTLEGCVVRISDVIAYIGRDIEDAIMIKLIRREDIPNEITEILGNSNDKIINKLVMNLISNSYAKPYLEFSSDIFNALQKLKKFNKNNIYLNEKIKTETEKINQMFRRLFAYYCKRIKNGKNDSDIFNFFLKDMKKDYIESTPIERQAIDFIAGMTDDFFNNQFKKLFVPKNFGYSLD